MSVAESIVMRAPIAQVGCRSACSGVTSASSAAERPRNGPPLAVTISASTAPASSPASSWCSAECSESTGSSCAPLRASASRTSGPPGDEALLVGERDVDARLERRQRRVEPGRADDGVEHDVRPALGRQLRDARRARQHAPGEAAARRSAAAGSASAIVRTPEALGLAHHAVDVAARGEGADVQLRIVVADLDRLPADRAGAAEERDAAHQPQGRTRARHLRPWRVAGRLRVIRGRFEAVWPNGTRTQCHLGSVQRHMALARSVTCRCPRAPGTPLATPFTPNGTRTQCHLANRGHTTVGPRAPTTHPMPHQPALGLAEQRDDRERRGPGEEQRVDAVEHAAVARQQRARVLDAEVALEERLEEVAERRGQRDADARRAAPADS